LEDMRRREGRTKSQEERVNSQTGLGKVQVTGIAMRREQKKKITQRSQRHGVRREDTPRPR